MLRKSAASRFAHNFSPLRERREVFFAADDDKKYWEWLAEDFASDEEKQRLAEQRRNETKNVVDFMTTVTTHDVQELLEDDPEVEIPKNDSPKSETHVTSTNPHAILSSKNTPTDNAGRRKDEVGTGTTATGENDDENEDDKPAKTKKTQEEEDQADDVSLEIKSEELNVRAKDTAQQMRDVERMVELEFPVKNEKTTLRKFIEKHGSDSNKKDFRENLTFIHDHNDEMDKIVGTLEYVEVIRNEQDPQEMREKMATLYSAANWDEAEPTLTKIDTYLQDHNEEIGKWNTDLSEDRKKEIRRDIWRLGKIAQIPDHLGKQVEKYRTGTEEFQKRLLIIQAGMKALGKIDKHGAHKGHGKFLKSLNIELYSLHEVWNAAKKIKEAYTHAWMERTELKATLLAKGGGKLIPGYVPFGAETRLNLDKSAEEANQKETNSFKEYLTVRNFTFRDLFLKHGEESIGHNLHEPNKARGILEYAAGRGWLYDITDSKTGKSKKIFGHSWDEMLSDWTQTQKDNYFIKLIGMNTSGEKSEAEAGKGREQTTDKAYLFIDAINKELDDLNFWGAIGVAQRAIERGLAGEISPWIATTMLRKLREDPDARKYVNRAVLDQLGIICLQHSAFTLNYFKTKRAVIETWAKTFQGDHLEEASDLGKIVLRIEETIIQRTGRTYNTLEDKKKLDQLVAKVLAGQLVWLNKDKPNEPKVFVSIFEKQFEDENFVDWHKPRQQATTNPDSEDDDYFRETSDVLLADGAVISGILDITGSGQFKHGQKAAHFIEKIGKVIRELDENGMKQEAENFRRIMGLKLENWITQWMLDSRSSPAAEENLPDEKTPAILTLIQAGFIRLETIKKGLDKQGKALAKRLLQQVAEAADGSRRTRDYPSTKPDPAALKAEAKKILEELQKKEDDEAKKSKKKAA